MTGSRAERARATRHGRMREGRGTIRKLQDSSFTLRELHRSAAVQAVALVCLVLLFAFIGPFGTYDSLGMGDRIGYWALADGRQLAGLRRHDDAGGRHRGRRLLAQTDAGDCRHGAARRRARHRRRLRRGGALPAGLLRAGRRAHDLSLGGGAGAGDRSFRRRGPGGAAPAGCGGCLPSLPRTEQEMPGPAPVARRARDSSTACRKSWAAISSVSRPPTTMSRRSPRLARPWC